MPNDLTKFSSQGHTNHTKTTATLPHQIPILYLIKPFTLNISLQNVDKTLAEFTMVVSLTDIRAELDASKLIRIMKIINLLIASFAGAAEEARLHVLSMGGAYSMDHILRLSGDASWGDQASGEESQPLGGDIDILTGSSRLPTVALMGIMVTLPSVSIALQVTPVHKIALVVSYVEVIVQQRPYDTQIDFKLRSVTIQDSLRATSQRFIVRSQDPVAPTSPTASPLSDAAPLLSVLYRGVLNTQSPYYQGFASSIDLVFDKLNLSIDEEAIARLAPFASDLSRGLQSLEEDAVMLSEMTVAEISRQSAALRSSLTSNKPTVIQRVKGTRVDVTVGKVSLELLARRSGPTPSTSEICELDPLYYLELTGLDVNARVEEGTSVEVELTNFSIVDMRQETALYVHRELLSRSILASEFASTRTTTLPTSDHKSINRISSRPNDRLLSVKYTADTASVQTIDISLNDVTCFLYVDSILDIVDTATKNVDALVLVSTAFATNNTSPDRSRPVSTSQASPVKSPNNLSATKLTPAKPRNSSSPTEPAAIATSCLSLRVAVSNPRVILLENPEARNSKAIVCTFELIFTFSQDVQNILTREQRDIVQVSLQAAELFVLVKGLKHGKPQQVIEPTGIELHVGRRLEQGQVLSVTVCLDSRGVAGKVSLNDLKLIKKIADRTKAAALQSLDKTKTTAKQPTDTSRPSIASTTSTASPTKPQQQQQQQQQQPLQVESKPSMTVFEATAHFGAVSVVAINDYYGQTLPVLRLLIEDSDFQGSGVLGVGCFNLSGSLYVSVDYFNAPLSVWEPVLERFCPEMSLTSASYQRMDLDLSCRQGTLQTTFSGSMVREVSKAVQLVSRIRRGAEDQSLARNEQHPLIFRNRLGCPVDIYESHSKRLVLHLDDDEPTPFPLDLFATPKFRSMANVHSALPGFYDIKLLGEFTDERLPLLDLPLNVSKAKAYYVHPAVDSDRGRGRRSSTVISEPVAEEVFENERFSPLTGRWESPWPGLGDPPRWTTAFGSAAPSPDQFPLGERWSWIEPNWTVDRSGKVDKEVDEDGWQVYTSSTYTQNTIIY